MKQLKKIFFITGLFAFAIVGTLFISGGRLFAQESPIAVEIPSPTPSETGDQILALLQELNVIQLDDTIFADPTFLSLKDYHVDLAEEPRERSNPFAPIGKDAVLTETPGTAGTVSTATKAPVSIPPTTPIPAGVSTPLI
ncbi:MAG: hypothetical protein NT098_04155 [Candidatus Parcubacteria bacterium]|nr:hypothetical protein [Candidatus Parcubacteria bacterium]